MIRWSGCRHWQPDRAADTAQQAAPTPRLGTPSRVFTRPELGTTLAGIHGKQLQSAAGFSPGRNTRRKRSSSECSRCNPRPGFHPAGTSKRRIRRGRSCVAIRGRVFTRPERPVHRRFPHGPEVAIRGRVFTLPEPPWFPSTRIGDQVAIRGRVFTRPERDGAPGETESPDVAIRGRVFTRPERR